MGRQIQSDVGPVMIVDDDEDQRTELAFFTRQLGHDVLCFESGEELLAAMIDTPPLLVILDINLPARNGIRIAEIASALDHRVRICFVSGSADRCMEARGLQLGLVFTKPLSFDTFKHILPPSRTNAI